MHGWPGGAICDYRSASLTLSTVWPGTREKNTVGMDRLDAFALRDEVVDTYAAYARGFTRISDPEVAKVVEGSLDGGELWPDPWVQINPTFKVEATTEDLVSRDPVTGMQLFHSDVQPSFSTPDGKPWQFYTHQVEAFRRAREGRPFVMTTGTGSGKSVTYIGPIIDHVLRTAPGTPGIHAINVYPMNALANSQFDALHEFLPGGCVNDAVDAQSGQFDASKLTNKVTFGRYTGQESLNVRKAMIERPPNILLTNYVMLELLLTRVYDRDLIRNANTLRFVVLDELHTYRGRQGADVALLLRRVAETAGQNKGVRVADDLLHIGTSATMASGGTPAEQRTTVAEVATTLFGSRVHPDDVIGETLERVTDQARAADVAAALNAGWTAPDDWETFRSDAVASWVESTIGAAPDGEGALRRQTPGQIPVLGVELAEDAGVDVEVATEAVTAAIRAGNTIEVPGTGRAAFPFRLHQFVTRGDEVYATVEHPSVRHVTLEDQQYASEDRTRSLFTLAFCRECGLDYYPVERVRDSAGQEWFVRREVSSVVAEQDGRLGYLFVPRGDVDWPRTVGPDRYTDPDVRTRLPADWLTFTQAGNETIEQGKREYVPEPLTVDGNGVVSGSGQQVLWLKRPFKFCLGCGVEYGPYVTSDLSKLGTLGMSGRSTATTMLTLSALEHLSDLRDRYAAEHPTATSGGGTFQPKLLNFTDNRQDASLQSGHFNDFVQVAALRAALLRVLGDAGPAGVGADHVASEVLAALNVQLSDYTTLDDEVEALPAGKNAKQTMLELLRHRLFVDLGGGYRISQPNLEQVGLLRIGYDGLGHAVGGETFWTKTARAPSQWVRTHDGPVDDTTVAGGSAFPGATPEQRIHAAQVLLDYLRRNLIVQDRALDGQKLEELKFRVAGTIVEPWNAGVDEDSRLTAGSDMAARPKQSAGRNKDNPGWRFITDRSTFGMWVARHAFDGPKLSQRDLADTIQHLIDTLVVTGYLVQSGVAPNGDPIYRINSETLVWLPGDGTPARDPVRVPNPPGDEHASSLNEFFKNFYEQVSVGLAALEAREHTAQISGDERQQREDRFREGKLNALFCSPTMELGIDISDLNVVGMRNVPPTPANYAQRAGRAGRSGQAALVLTYCSVRSPHDRFYFDRPTEMVAGAVAAPNLDLLNEDLIRSHVQAIWLAETRADLGKSMTEDVLDVHYTFGHVPTFTLKDDIASKFASKAASGQAREIAHRVLGNVRGLATARWWVDDPNWIDTVIAEAPTEFDAATERWRQMYEAATVQSDESHQRLNSTSARLTRREKREAETARREAQAQLDLLRGGLSLTSDFYTYRYFASEGFLPGYSFPRLPLSAFIPQRRGDLETNPAVTRPRFLAISEFGPRTFIYHNGARYKVTKVMLPVETSTVRDDGESALLHSGRLCLSCGHFYGPDDALLDKCRNCSAPMNLAQEHRKLFRLTAVSTRKVENISSVEEERTRLGYELRTAFSFARRKDGRVDATRAVAADTSGRDLLELTYAPTATLTRMNLGWSRRKDKHEFGFHLDLATGVWADKPEQETDQETGAAKASDDPTASSNTIRQVVPFVTDTRNCLIVRPTAALLADRDGNAVRDRAAFVASLEAALAVAVREKYELEDDELQTVPLPTRDSDERDAFLMYEASEGGAGVLRQLVENPADLSDCALRALHRCHYVPDDAAPAGWADTGRASGRTDDCVAACYDCLLAYGNQPDHPMLDRKDTDGYGLKTALIRLLPTAVAADSDGAPDAAANQTSADDPTVALAADARATYGQIDVLLGQTASGQERRFLELLMAQGRRLPDMGQRTYDIGVDGPASADFVYVGKGRADTLVFIDGHPHCDVDQADIDRVVTENADDINLHVLRFRACPQHHPDESSDAAWTAVFDAHRDLFGDAR